MLTINDFLKFKNEKKKISMVTCYDYWSAKLLDESKVDCLLVGDSLAMVMHGHSTTLPATVELMALHTAAVCRGSKNKFVVGDMPFLSFRQGVETAVRAAGELMKVGAHAVKLEGVKGHQDAIKQIVGSGIPVMGHIGLTPQSVFSLGGMKVQGRDSLAAQDLLSQAKELEALGCFSIVLECVPNLVGKMISEELKIPTIGIGAGNFTDGQVLVLHDLLGANREFNPKFLRKYANLSSITIEAVDQFDQDVKTEKFPSEKESYS